MVVYHWRVGLWAQLDAVSMVCSTQHGAHSTMVALAVFSIVDFNRKNTFCLDNFHLV